jgi:hypothetical protein
VGPQLDACPHCGVSLDAPMPERPPRRNG